ncbi:MAG TPA: nucleotide exchange factor GrpE [Terriglobia bacterium]|nr:nucleotide exchange factor GrpE [Terriglobia bacterium]
MPKQVESLEEELRIEHDLYLRALADFANYRRRMERAQTEFGILARRELIIPLLDIVDDFERALGAEGAGENSFLEGMRAVHKKLTALLEKEGIHAFESVGEPFDPARHEATASAPAVDQAPGTVVQEIRRGYRQGDDVLRPARVIVAQ